jgi:hypothetical protein
LASRELVAMGVLIVDKRVASVFVDISNLSRKSDVTIVNNVPIAPNTKLELTIGISHYGIGF